MSESRRIRQITPDPAFPEVPVPLVLDDLDYPDNLKIRRSAKVKSRARFILHSDDSDEEMIDELASDSDLDLGPGPGRAEGELEENTDKPSLHVPSSLNQWCEPCLRMSRRKCLVSEDQVRKERHSCETCRRCKKGCSWVISRESIEFKRKELAGEITGQRRRKRLGGTESGGKKETMARTAETKPWAAGPSKETLELAEAIRIGLEPLVKFMRASQAYGEE